MLRVSLFLATFILVQTARAERGGAIVEHTLAAANQAGKPLFVVAGATWCGPCKQLEKEMTTNSSVQAKAKYFVYLHIDVDDAEQKRVWQNHYPNPINGIPMLFFVRSDGTLVHTQSGAPQGEGLIRFLDEQLTKAGRQLTDEQLQSMQKAVDEAKSLASEKRYTGALAKLEKYMNTGSFQPAARAADELTLDIAKKGKDVFAEVEKDLADSERRLQAAIDLAATVRMFNKTAELKKFGGQVVNKLRRDPELKDVVRQGEMLDAAQELEDKKNGSRKAALTYQKLVDSFPDTPAAKRAAERLTALGQTVVKKDAGVAKTPSASNDAKKAASYVKMAKTLKANNNPSKAKEFAQKAVDLAPESESAKEARNLIAEIDGG
jgi:hypothetical protein